MRFEPKTENEIASENLFEPGIYDFTIVKAEDAISKKSGSEMIALTLRVFDAEGSARLVNDYLMEKIAYKLRHAADVCGLLQSYERGTLEGVDFMGKSGRVKIGIQKDKAGQYPDKNNVVDYVASDTPSARATARATSSRAPAMASSAADLDDDIPF